MFLLLTVALAAGELPVATGVVQVARASGEPAVHLVRKAPAAPLRLAGELVRELASLPSATVEVVGPEDDKGSLVVRGYRILAVAGGARPVVVGVVVPAGELGLGVSTDAGPALPLSAAPALREALQGLVGAKVWIIGKKLLSGEIKVERYGVLLRPPGRSAPPH